MLPRPGMSARVQALMPPLVAVLTLVAFSVIVDIFAVRFPPHFGETQWRFQTVNLFLSAGPQLSLVLGIIAVVGIFGGYRGAVRGAAIAALVLAVLLVVLTPLFGLDVLEIRRQVSLDNKRTFDLVTLKTAVFSVAFAVVDFWAGRRGLQVSQPDADEDLRATTGRGTLVTAD